MKAIVTGASGFLGRRIAAGLAADPRIARVTGFDQAVPPEAGGFETIAADIARFAELAPPAGLVVHGAAITTQASERDPDLAYAINVEGTRQVLRWARAQPAPPRVVLLSSVAVFGAGDEVADEATPPDPQGTYGTTKLVAERLVMDATRRGEADGVILRLPVIIVRSGARVPRPGAGFASAFIDSALRGLECASPFAADHAMPVGSARAALALILRAALGPTPAPLLHMPALPASPRRLEAALAACGIPARSTIEADAEAAALVKGWPERLGTRHPSFSADVADAGLEEIIQDHAASLGLRP